MMQMYKLFLIDTIIYINIYKVINNLNVNYYNQNKAF